MSILTLPPELLGIIIRKLDMKSVYNLYEAGVSCMQGLVTKCQFSMNTLATAKSLRSSFCVGVSGYLKSLNLSGVSDLDLPSLIDALANMNSLINLDVSYTNIIVPEFLQIVKARPTLKSIGINFSFGEYDVLNISKDMLSEYQQAFEGFKYVNLVCKPGEDFRGKLAILMLQMADFLNLKITYCHCVDLNWNEHYNNIDCNSIKMLELSQFQIYLLSGFKSSMLDLPMFRFMDFKKYEIVVFSYCDSESPVTKVLATSSLSKLISEKFNIKVADLTKLNYFSEQDNIVSSYGQSVFIFWDKERTKFDDDFYSYLFNIVKEYLLFHIDNPYNSVPDYKWYTVYLSVNPNLLYDTRIQLDYSNAFQKEKGKINLDVMMNYACYTDQIDEIEIRNINFLRKLNHFSLRTDIMLQKDVLKNLFDVADSLVTLELIVGHNLTDEYFQPIKENRSLKNIFIKCYGLDLSRLFRCLSKCIKLENIYLNLLHSGYAINCLKDPSDLFNQCNNLYNITINLNMDVETFKKMSRLYEKVKLDLQRDGLHIDIKNSNEDTYSPYLSVFRFFMLKPL